MTDDQHIPSPTATNLLAHLNDSQWQLAWEEYQAAVAAQHIIDDQTQRAA